MKTSYNLILLGVVITGFWLSGLAWMQITHTHFALLGSISTGTHVEDGVQVKSVRVIPNFSMIPFTGIPLVTIGIIFRMRDKRK